MILIRFAAILASLMICSQVMAQEIDMKKCKYEFDATNAALGMRDHGKTKADMEATLPPRHKTTSDQRALLLHTIIDDIYSRPDVASFPYFHYRGIMCLTRAQGIDTSIPFEQVADDLVACQTKHGTAKSEPLSNCVLAAVQKQL